MEEERSGEIYVITCTVTNKQYVGQALHYTFVKGKRKKHGTMGRWKTHQRELKKRKTLLCYAILKYGKDSFQVKKIEDCKTQEDLNKREQFWIAELNTLSPNGYNLTTGGGQCKFSDEYKQKLSDATKQYFEDTTHKVEQSNRIEQHFSKKRKSFFDDKHVTKVCIRDINATKTKPHIRTYVYYTIGDDPKEHSTRTNFQYNDKTKDEANQRATEFAQSLTTNIVTEKYHQQQTGLCNKVHFHNKRQKFFENKTILHVSSLQHTQSQITKSHFYVKVEYATPLNTTTQKTRTTYFFYKDEPTKEDAHKQGTEFIATMTAKIQPIQTIETPIQ